LAAAIAVAAPFVWSSAMGLVRPGIATPVTNPADFRAFYCAARTLGEGRDPYLTEPLRSCEQASARAFGLRMFDGLVLPAPLPPYALAVLIPLARLDFRVASPLWLFVSLVAFAASCVLAARLARRPTAVTTLALLGPLAYVSLPLGQIMPAVVALLCGAALALRARRSWLAASLCALATVEPHVVIPACIAAFISCSRTRAAFVLCGCCAVLASLWFGGPILIAEYGARVVPLHALSQVDDFPIQYSLTAVARALGASTYNALLAGSISYAILVALGIVVSQRLARHFRDDAFIVLVPPAFAVLGGTFVHLAQIAVAAPALLLLASHLPRRTPARGFAIAASIALAVPWSTVANESPFANAIWPHAVAPRSVTLPFHSAGLFAEQTETTFYRGGGYGSNGGPLAIDAAFKLPTWFGLLCFSTLAIGLAFPRVSLRSGYGTNVAPNIF